MPRRKPTEVVEQRRSLGTWERNLEETRVTGEVIRNVGVGIGSALGPFSLIGAAILAGLFFKNKIEDLPDIKDKIQEIFSPGGPLDPNTGDADDYINEQMTAPGVPGEPSAMGKYISGKVAQFDARKEAYTQTGGTGPVAAGWEAYKEANPIPLEVVNQEAIYQISIRATAGRRYAAQFVPLGGPVATWFGMLMPGEYYTDPKDAQGYIADPMLDLLAVRSINQASWRNSTRTGAFNGRQIEIALKLPWALESDDPTSAPPDVQEELGITEANPQWVEWWIIEAKKQGRYGPSVGDTKHHSWWYAIEHMGKDPYTYDDWLNDTGRA